MAYVVMAFIVMAYIVMAQAGPSTLLSSSFQRANDRSSFGVALGASLRFPEITVPPFQPDLSLLDGDSDDGTGRPPPAVPDDAAPQLGKGTLCAKCRLEPI